MLSYASENSSNIDFVGRTATRGTQCPKGKHWVSAHFRSACYRADGTFVKASNVSAHCRTNPAGYAVWHSKLKNHRPKVWRFTKEQSKKWTTEEIERLLEALAELPEELTEQVVKGLYRMKDSVEQGNPATTNFGDIALYDTAFSKKYKLAQVVAHELAHELYRSLPDEVKVQYQTATGWSKQKLGGVTILSSRDKSKFVDQDGRALPEEDFANNIEYFMFHPKQLQKVTPSAYRWIKKRFGDR